MMITVDIQCPFCGKLHSVEVEESHYLDWKDGELAQNAMPELSPTEREQLISGMCPTCQKEVFGY